jgi:predicted metal-dependent HD superfamily phosphohydrolase
MNFQPLLDKWGIQWDAKELLDMWNEPHRAYHTDSHLNDLVRQIAECDEVNDHEREMLYIAALFHDVVYEPWRSDNEIRSVHILLERAPDTEDIRHIAQIISDTRTHRPTSVLSAIFCQMDMSVVLEPWEELIAWEVGIAFEYSFLSKDEYRKKRLEFLREMLRVYPQNAKNLQMLIDALSR